MLTAQRDKHSFHSSKPPSASCTQLANMETFEAVKEQSSPLCRDAVKSPQGTSVPFKLSATANVNRGAWQGLPVTHGREFYLQPLPQSMLIWTLWIKLPTKHKTFPRVSSYLMYQTCKRSMALTPSGLLPPHLLPVQSTGWSKLPATPSAPHWCVHGHGTCHAWASRAWTAASVQVQLWKGSTAEHIARSSPQRMVWPVKRASGR